MLGDLRNVRCRAEFLDEDGECCSRRDLTLSALGLSHTDALYLSAVERSRALPSDLERLLEHHLRRARAGRRSRRTRGSGSTYERTAGLQPASSASASSSSSTPPSGRRSSAARALDDRDLAQASSESPTGVDAAELGPRRPRGGVAAAGATSRSPRS